MRDRRRFLQWCLRQSKGIALAKPSENLVRAYLGKSRNALKSMEVNANEGLMEWAVSASYYAKYFVVYALLAKTGVKCEIHDCTISLFEYLFGNLVPRQLVQELRDSKEHRVETQYYPVAVEADLEKEMDQTKNFVLEIEKILDGLTADNVAELRFRIEKLKPLRISRRHQK